MSGRLEPTGRTSWEVAKEDKPLVYDPKPGMPGYLPMQAVKAVLPRKKKRSRWERFKDRF